MKPMLSILCFIPFLGLMAQDSGFQVEKTFLEVDIAVNAITARVNGDQFVVEGYIYPAGTLGETNGIRFDGTPEFPDLMLGTWVCDGWQMPDRQNTEPVAGPRTTQTYEFFNEDLGVNMIVTFGYEPGAPAQVATRAITGGTGDYSDLRGVQKQEVIGLNLSGAVNLKVAFTSTTTINFKNK